MSSPVPAPEGRFTESRIGIVTLATINSIFVDVGGTVVETAFLAPFVSGTVVPPVAGTVVHLVRQDASWITTGAVVGAGANTILNPSFEDSVAGSFPANWETYNISGSSTVAVTDIVGAPDGDFVARVFSAVSSVHYLYSSPIPVTAGEIWSLSAFAGGDYAAGPFTADAAIVALWFANATNLYPTTSSPDTLVTNDLDLPQYPPFHALFQTVTVPVTGFMRVALRSTLAAGQALLWDQVIARRV